MLPQLQSAVLPGLQDENCPPRSDPRFPAPPLPMPRLGDDPRANSHESTRPSVPSSPHLYPHTGPPHSVPLVPIQSSNDIQKQVTVSTSPSAQPIPIQPVVPGPTITLIGGVISSLPAPGAGTFDPVRRIFEAGHAGQHHHGEFEPKTSPRGRSPEQALEDGQRTFQLHSLLKDAEPEVLEAGVQQGLRLLRNLRSPLTARAAETLDASEWVKQIGR